MSEAGGRRYDPQRRGRILEVALDVIAEHGVAGTTHRRVAAAANVPLGSMTYHFTGMDDLLFAAFERLAVSTAELYRTRLEAAKDVAQARAAVVDLICDGTWTSPRNMALTFELYAYSIRNPRLRSVWRGWMAGSRAALERHFTPETARVLDAAIEGITIHNSVEPESISRADVERIVDRLSR